MATYQEIKNEYEETGRETAKRKKQEEESEGLGGA